jgi:AbrB family looped-hinge helix DNA binding protein
VNTADRPICRFCYHVVVQSYTTRLEKSGRILIPAALRRHLGLSVGSPVIIKLDESGALEITSRSQALAKVQRELRKYIPKGEDPAAELIRDRLAEVERENKESSRK